MNDLDTFNKRSKSKTGVHMFKFEKPDDPNSVPIYIASDVTNEQNILDVTYRQFSKTYEATTPEKPHQPKVAFVKPKTKLREIWRVTHTFSSGRIAMTLVWVLLNQGYVMSEISP